MKVVLTGITGFLGSHLAHAFITKGWEVFGIKRASSSLYRIHDIIKDLRLFDVDEISMEDIFAQIGHADIVVHTATNYGRKNKSLYDMFYANLAFPLEILEYAIKSGIKRFYNTDTCFNKPGITGNYMRTYRLSKAQFTQWAQIAVEGSDTKFITVRPEYFYGPGDDTTKLVPFALESCLDNVSHISLTPGEQMRDFVYIHDVVSAYLTIIASDKDTEIFGIGTGQVVSLREFLEEIKKKTKAHTALCFGARKYPPDEIMFSQADIEPLRMLGWQPQYDMKKGIQEYIDFCKEVRSENCV